MVNPTYLMGNSLLMDTCICFGLSVIFGMSLVTGYQDWTQTLHLFTFISHLKHRCIRYPLYTYNMRRFAIKFNILTKYVMDPLIVSLSTILGPVAV